MTPFNVVSLSETRSVARQISPADLSEIARAVQRAAQAGFNLSGVAPPTKTAPG